MDKGKQEGPSRQDTPVPRRRCERLGSVELNVFVKVRVQDGLCREGGEVDITDKINIVCTLIQRRFIGQELQSSAKGYCSYTL